MDLTQTTAADYLKARDLVAAEVGRHSQVHANTRREIAEALMAKGWLDVPSILESVKPAALPQINLHPHPGAPEGAR